MTSQHPPVSGRNEFPDIWQGNLIDFEFSALHFSRFIWAETDFPIIDKAFIA